MSMLPIHPPDYFNSQPHEEADDFRFRISLKILFISTHSLTKRLTTGFQFVSNVFDISTHSLTKRLTVYDREYILVTADFNSQPHEEADSNFRQKYIYLKLFFTLIAHTNLVFLFKLLYEGADIFLDYLSDQSKSMSVLYRTQIS